MSIKIFNLKESDTVNISLPLITGEISIPCNGEIYVDNKTARTGRIAWPVIHGKFKALVSLIPGKNMITITHKNETLDLILRYTSLTNRRFIKLVYIMCDEHDGRFQAPKGEDNSLASARNRISLGLRMIQSFMYDSLVEHGFQRQTFRIDEKDGMICCHFFKTKLSLTEAMEMNEHELWAYFAVELMNSSMRVGDDCKFLAFLSFTHYSNNTNLSPKNHQESLQMTKGHAAIGGGGLALLGTGCLHTWAEDVQQIPWRFGDRRLVNRMQFLDDSGNRRSHWGCYATGLGATLHELGHIFDLGHTDSGIMERGCDDIYKYFIVDMFYLDHTFQKKRNPHYQRPSSQHHTVSLSVSSTVTWAPLMEETQDELMDDDEQNLCENIQPPDTSADNFLEEKNMNVNPMRIPHLRSRPAQDPYLHASLGRLFWERSNALLLHFHKWFNDSCSGDKSVSLRGTTFCSPHGLRVIEFRISEEVSIHHLEFLDGEGPTEVDIREYDLGALKLKKQPSFTVLAEDNNGGILKVKFIMDDIFPCSLM